MKCGMLIYKEWKIEALERLPELSAKKKEIFGMREKEI
jgi:hypothetical protein